MKIGLVSLALATIRRRLIVASVSTMEFLIALLFSLLNIPIAQADGHAMSSRPEYGLPSAARVQYGMPYAVVPPEASRRLTTRTTPVKAPVPAARTAQAKPTPAGAPIPAPKVIAATAKASPAPAQTFTAPAPAPTPALQPAPVLPPAPQPVPEPIAEPKTSAVPAATPIELGALERYILIETNAVRVQNGLGMLVADGRLSSIARAHSADMLSKEYFAHTNLAGCSASCRMTSGGYGWQMMGENL